MSESADSPARIYRLFRVTNAGRVVSVADTLEARTDEEAISRAQGLTTSQNLELWDGARLVWKASTSDALRAAP